MTMKLTKIFTILLVILPVLSIYSIPNSKVLVFVVIVAALYPFMLYAILKKDEKVNKTFYYPLLVLLLYIIIQFAVLLVIIGVDDINTVLLRTLHNIFYLVTAIVFIKQYFDVEIGKKVLNFMAVFSSIYIIIQFVLINTIGYYLPGTLPFFETSVDEFNESIIASGMTIRPRSIFSEPSAYGAYIGLYLIIDLFSADKKRFADYIPNILASIGLLLSRSTSAYLLGFGIWTLWSVHKFMKNSVTKKGKFLLAAIILVPIIFYYIAQTESFSIFIEHTFGSGSGEWGIGVMNRIRNYSYAFSTQNLSNFEILFGRGMQTPDYYIPGIPRMFFYFGIIGILIWFSIYLYIFFVSNWPQRRVLLLMIVSSFFGDSIFGINCLIYFPFIVTLNKSSINTFGKRETTSIKLKEEEV